MIEPVALLVGLGIVLVVVAFVLHVLVWLAFSTPFLTWCLIGLNLLLAFKLLLPFSYTHEGGTKPRALEEELRAKQRILLTTWIGKRDSSGYPLSAIVAITNSSDRTIDRVSVWCRVPQGSLEETETFRESFSVKLGPGETKTFSGQITEGLTGVVKPGFHGYQPPDQHFCRVDRVYEATG